MSKKKKIIALTAILIAIFVSFIGGQTFSKYITEVNGVGKAEIAAWNFKVNENEEQLQTIKLASTANNESLINHKIAPGTKGSFIIKIDGTGSDVGIQYDIRIENETRKPSNLVYTYNEKKYTDINEIAKDASGTIGANEENKIKDIQVQWEWKYETGNTEQEKSVNNQKDTQDGKTIKEYTFDIIVTGTQVLPNA